VHDHSETLALAAAAIDFELDPGERSRLDSALATCLLCRRRAASLGATATILRRPSDTGTPARVREVVVGAALRDGRRTSALRSLLAVSLTLFVVLGGTAVLVGNRGLDNPLPSDSASAPPSPTTSSDTPTATSPSPSPIATPTSTREPTPEPTTAAPVTLTVVVRGFTPSWIEIYEQAVPSDPALEHSCTNSTTCAETVPFGSRMSVKVFASVPFVLTCPDNGSPDGPGLINGTWVGWCGEPPPIEMNADKTVEASLAGP
jgi:hypothetical protein